jgi:type II secretory pathway pseudopilin PulG
VTGRPSTEGGYTLVETMVVVVLLTVVMGFVTETIISTQRAFTRSSIRLTDTGELRVAFDTMTKTIRTATRLDSTSPAFLPGRENGVECWFYANLESNPAPQLAHYYLDGTRQLIEELTHADVGSVGPNWTYTGAPYRHRVIAREVVVPPATGTPIFTYFDQSGTVLNIAGDVNADIADANLSGIGDVLIRLSVSSGPAPLATTTTLVNRVRLVNADVPANTAGSR